MAPHTQLTALLNGHAPLLTLAPMQDVTDGAFWTLIHHYGGADVYWTEYFRVHADSTPERGFSTPSRQHDRAGRSSRR